LTTLQIYRDRLPPGTDAIYRQIEEDAARICAELGGPHPYLAIESLTGSKEVWFLNGYSSPAEIKQVSDAYVKNAPLMAALNEIIKRKAPLNLEPIEVFADYQPELSRGEAWSLGQGRFLVVTVTRSNKPTEGTVFAAKDGTRYVVLSAQTRDEADAKAAAAGPEANVFAVRPSWSLPAKEWIPADPAFWRPAR
jgi:hypothetical protein